MNIFILDLKHQPGELAKATEAIAKKGIDITAFSGVTCGGSGTVALLTNDEVGARRALTEAGYHARELEVVTTTFGNASSLSTSASFSEAGVYVLRLTASDSALSASDDVQVTAMLPAQRCTIASVAGHAMYERSNPYEELFAGGRLGEYRRAVAKRPMTQAAQLSQRLLATTKRTRVTSFLVANGQADKTRR